MDAAGAGSSALTKTGAGSWRLTAANSYTGATEVANGTLQLGTATALGASSGVTVSAGGALDLYGQNVATVIPLTLNGSGVSNAGALTNSSSTGATYAGLVDLGSASSVVGVLGTIDLSNAGAITGAYELTLGGKGGSVSSVISTSGLRLRTLSTISQVVAPASPGIWTLLAANTYTGTTTLHTGTLRLGVANAIPSSSAVTVGDSGILDVAGTSIANPISMSSVGYVFNSSAGTNSVLSGQISTANGNGTLAAIAGATITIPADGVGTRGAGLLSIGTSQLAGYSGTVVFAGSNNSHSGTTYVNASATLFLGDADALTNVGRVQMANSGIVDLNGFSTAKTLELERDGVIANKAFGTNSVLTGGILILTSNNTTNLVAVSGATITVRTTGITTSGNGSLTIGGAAYTGTVVLETNNSYVGGTRVVGGKVVLGVDPAVYTTLFPATGSFSVNSGGTLDLMGYTVTSLSRGQWRQFDHQHWQCGGHDRCAHDERLRN
jgi:autotransporter-associated beta strand protein